jgi:hypothetical protein
MRWGSCSERAAKVAQCVTFRSRQKLVNDQHSEGATMSEQHIDTRPADNRNALALEPAPMTTEAAEQIVERLVEQRAAHVAAGDELIERRRRASHAKYINHDPEAAKELTEIHDAVVVHQSELESIDAAISVAKANVVEAQRRVVAEADAEMALELKAEVEEFRRLSAVMDELLLGLSDTAVELGECLNRIRGLGSDFPSHQQLQILGELALRTAIMATPWKKTVELVPPGQRHGFAALIGQWCANIERNNIEPRLSADQTNNDTNEAA